MKIDTSVESFRPLNHRRVEMRVRNRDDTNSTDASNQVHRDVIKVRNAVPQDVAFLCANQLRVLPNSEFRHSLNAPQIGFVLIERVSISMSLHIRERRPPLAFASNILPLVLANRTCGWWQIGLWVLRATGHTDPCRHKVHPFHSLHSVASLRTLRRTSRASNISVPARPTEKNTVIPRRSGATQDCVANNSPSSITGFVAIVEMCGSE